MRLVILPLIAALATAALSGCLDVHDDCSEADHEEEFGDDDRYAYEYEYEYQGGHSGQASGSGQGSSHSASYSFSYGDPEEEDEDYEEASWCEENEEEWEDDWEDGTVEEPRYSVPVRSADREAEDTEDLPMVIESLYSGVWSGSGDIEDGFAIENQYHFLITNLIHQGQSAGDGFRYTDPEEGDMDHACLTIGSGQTLMTRSLPPSIGQAEFSFDGRVAGQTTFDAWGYRGVIPPTLLHYLHQGQRADLPLPLGTSVGFYVPPGIGEIQIDLLHQGQALLGARLYDAEGKEVANIESSSGQEVHATASEGVAGIWTLELDGVRAGQFQVSVRPSVVGDTPELPAPQ